MSSGLLCWRKPMPSKGISPDIYDIFCFYCLHPKTKSMGHLFVRICGSYTDMSSGTPSEAMMDFTGGVHMCIQLSDPPNNLLELMCRAAKSSALMGCGTHPGVRSKVSHWSNNDFVTVITITVVTCSDYDIYRMLTNDKNCEVRDFFSPFFVNILLVGTIIFFHLIT